jgi:ATP:ADP antiporter, AAA family
VHVPSAVPLNELAPEARAAIESGRRAFIGAFYGNFYSAVNAVSFLLQALVVSRLIKHFGLRALLFAVPAVAMIGYGGVAFLPTLGVVAATKLAENSLDYSAQNTARQALFLPTSREVKYKAKAALDTWFVRLGDALAAGGVAAGVHLLGLDRRGFAAANLIVGGLLGLVVLGIAQRHRVLAKEAARTRGQLRPTRRLAPA